MQAQELRNRPDIPFSWLDGIKHDLEQALVSLDFSFVC